jgi:hypothetical protein
MSVHHSKLSRRHIHTIDDDGTAESDKAIPISTTPVQQDDNKVDDELSEQQLRELYDSDEINRILGLFPAVSLCCCCPIQANMILFALVCH